MPIRVIAGSAKGRRLKLVPGEGTRPIQDRVKESLFNIIGRDIVGTAFLDLFSGTGSVAIEALSRGAEFALLVEQERKAVKIIQSNLEITKLADKAVIRQTDVFALLRQRPAQHFDYIYIAPPQYLGLWQRTLEALEANPAWIPEGVVVIVQIDPSEEQPVDLNQLVEVDRRRYGRTLLWFFESQHPLYTESVTEE